MKKIGKNKRFFNATFEVEFFNHILERLRVIERRDTYKEVSLSLSLLYHLWISNSYNVMASELS